VVENNAVFVKVKLQEDERPIAIQRDLMIYFLEDALFSENIKDRGANMLKNYFSELDEEKTSAIKALKQQDTVGIMEKTGLKKILPRRLLNRYLAAEQNDPNSGLQHILEHAKAQEERYERLRKKAIALDELQAKHPSVTNIEKSREALFDDKNKGKNFKLNFIRKACHIMYFKDIYRQKSEQEGHHKRFHITRDEYNNFCKWMYTFDTIPYYKTQLNALFTSKGFYKNEEFREIIEESENLNEIYNKVKEKYGDWLKRNKDATKNRQYNVCSYCQLLNKGVRYINVWHFKQFLAKNGYLKRENNGKFVYPSLKNKEYLFPDYYIEMPTQKAQHEDCLLYELVMRYFNEDATVTQQARTSVQTILNTELDFLQEYKEGAQNKTYTVSVPIKDVEKWIELKEFSKTKSLLERLPAYLAKNEKSKELRDVALEFNKSKKIALSDFSKVNNHIINNQAKFTCCVMALEKFYIQKQNLTIPEEGWLDIPDIKELKDYSDLKKWRNIAFHFDLPMDKTFQDVFREIEKRFAKEICKDWTIETMPRMYKEVLEVFLNKMRNDIFDKSKTYRDVSGARIQETDNEKIRQKALREYLAEMKLKQLFN
jgi:hypothetical protein